MDSAPFQLGKLTRREFRERMQRGELRASVIPIGAIEQHLEHLALEHDWRSVTAVAHAAARLLSPHVIVAEGCLAGISEHHFSHGGTLSLRPATMLAVVNDLIRSMVLAGFRHILVLNGHGGNIEPLRGSWDQYLREFRVNLQFISYWDVLNENDAEELLHGGKRLPEDLPGHAQEFETSLGLSCFPENVRRDALMDQDDASPQLATAAQGQTFFERIVARLVSHLQAMMDGRSVASIPGFFP